MRGGEGKGTSPPERGDFEGPRGMNPYTPMIPDSGCKPKYTPRREPGNPSGYGRRGEFEGERVHKGRGKSVHLPKSLKFEGKSNWKAFYAKFSVMQK